eukprot:CAMPEP_0195514418 /NCGR_PEP_ID=MMETSP0794_2-20130614/5812_1 /TAXON_ID=515487 /ORGANISM="Stephanopyxis turris, Strain CCMP 815" /LENGTH=760 /DNA_ID=CAMNT_0040642661 /DNA_START=144 /DNA_END=2423 /DNA_ORIENTATION=+
MDENKGSDKCTDRNGDGCDEDKVIHNGTLVSNPANEVSQSNVYSSAISSSSLSEGGILPDAHDGKCSATLTPSILNVLATKVDSSLKNEKQWCIAGVEDAILCPENDLFPLGLTVRRFFPKYGFHDGRITKIQRRMLFDEVNGIERPVMLYRSLYEDGDQEDFMHHEIASLRQLYDIHNIAPTAPPASQIPPGTLYECQKQGSVQIVEHFTPVGAANPGEGGMVRAKFRKIGCPWTELELDLVELQLNIVRKVMNGGSSLTRPNTALSSEEGSKVPQQDAGLPLVKSGKVLQRNPFLASRVIPPQNISPLLEWPAEPVASDTDGNEIKCEEIMQKDLMLGPGIWLLSEKSAHFPEPEEEETSRLVHISPSDYSTSFINDPNSMRSSVSKPNLRWDPANVHEHFLWDPYGNIICEICKIDKDDHQILICDTCHLGYHMYCVRPVIVNVPRSEWICSRCSVGRSEEASFADTMKGYGDNLVATFLNLPYEDLKQFHVLNQKGLDLIAPTTHGSRRQAIPGSSRSKPTVKVGSFYYSHNSNKNDWVLPVPLLSSKLYALSLTSMVAAMRYCGMTTYSEELVYSENGVTEAMNDITLDQVGSMSQRNLDIFKQFKHNVKTGIFAPVKIVYEDKVGFTVEALGIIARHTLITEYVGEVTTVERSGETSSDSLMMLLNTGDPKTSLIIDPTKTGNIARFLSGVNNGCQLSRRKANVRTRRFVLDGKCRIALFAAKKIEAGDKLVYDYNAGIEGKNVMEWAKNGFYD